MTTTKRSLCSSQFESPTILSIALDRRNQELSRLLAAPFVRLAGDVVSAFETGRFTNLAGALFLRKLSH